MSKPDNYQIAQRLVLEFETDYEVTIRQKPNSSGTPLIQRIIQVLDNRDNYYTEMMS